MQEMRGKVAGGGLGVGVKGFRGWFFSGRDFDEGEYTLVWENDELKIEDGYEGPKSGVIEGILFPALVNAHVHTGDYMLYFKERRYMRSDLAELVEPPWGIKHRALEGNDGVEKFIASTLRESWECGVSGVIDFREGGVRGVEAAKTAWEALDIGIEHKIFGRPGGGDDINALIEASDGIGLPDIKTTVDAKVRGLVDSARARGMPVAVHFAETEREDIDALLDMGPTIAVHLSMLSREDMEAILGAGIFPVFCPRTNYTFARIGPVEAVLEMEAGFGLGTDNMMLSGPNILADMELLWRHAIRLHGTGALDMELRDVACAIFRSVTTYPRERLGIGKEHYAYIDAHPSAVWEFIMNRASNYRPVILTPGQI